MNKLALSSLIIASIILSPTLRADSPAGAPDTEMQSEPSAAPTSPAQDNREMATTPETSSTEDEGTSVSAEENTANKAAKKRQWFNIFLAVAAVVVAVTAMILVAHNDGHKA